jgi:hypothetical protein
MQSQRVKNILIGLVVLGIVLLAVLGPQYLPKFTKLHSVFDSPINMGLVSVLVVLITIFDVKIGVAFAFLVLMFAVYLMDEKNTKRLENFFADVTTVTGVVTKTGQGAQGQQEFSAPRLASIRLDPITEPIDKLGELMSELTQQPSVAPKALIPKEGFEDVTTTDMATTSTTMMDNTNTQNKVDATNKTEMSMQPIADHVQKILAAGSNQTPVACATPQQYDFLTQQVPNYQNTINRFDVVGARYDLQSRPQNLTVYGPPLSWCATYDQQQASKCGTFFYPLNG